MAEEEDNDAHVEQVGANHHLPPPQELARLRAPVTVIDTLRISHSFKQTAALVVGGIAGLASYVGCTLLLHRRLFDARIRKSSSMGDILVLVLIWVQLTLGILTTWWTLEHLDGSEMLRFMNWANGILTLDPGAPQQIQDVALVYKLHISLGLTLGLITPFTRLVHIWSAPVWYLLRPGFQIVRTRRARNAARSPTHGPAGVAPSYGGPTVLRQLAESGQEGA